MPSDRVLDILVALQRRFPAWAAWVDGAGRWTATRADARRGGPLLWVYADTPDGLAERMADADRPPP